MARTPINIAQGAARAPVNQTLVQALINNDDDHEDRIVTLENYGQNWADQLGTALTDTNMGVFTGNILPDNSSVKSCLQTTENRLSHVPYLDNMTYSILPEDTQSFNSSGNYLTAQTSFVIRCYKTTFFSTSFRANIKSDVSTTTNRTFRLQITNSTYLGTKYIYFNAASITNWNQANYNNYYFFVPDNADNGVVLTNLSSWTDYTCQLQWAIIDPFSLTKNLWIRNTTYYFAY
jgi:hypothetical protein